MAGSYKYVERSRDVITINHVFAVQPSTAIIDIIAALIKYIYASVLRAVKINDVYPRTF